MRYAILSDVHGNLEALDAVLKKIREVSPDRVLFLGDAVGYGPDPNACVEGIAAVADRAVAGNHDHAALGLTDIESFNPVAREALLWTRSVLSAGARDRIRAMPLIDREGDLLLVHASPDDPAGWPYLLSAVDAVRAFRSFEERICLVGHSHRPAVYATDGNGIWEAPESVLTLEPGFRYIVNAGSVGQPRDGNPDAGFVLYDGERGRLSFERVPYDLRSTQKKMRAAHLPSFLVERLAYGA